MDISAIRKNYILHSLDEDETGEEPLVFFAGWLAQAITAEVIEPTAMVLSTVGSDCRPSSRVVLLKGLESGEFRFFTNYESNKGQQLNNNPFAALAFFWKELERAVRVEGSVHKINSEDSDLYFDSRPWESRLGAIASPQSSVIESREVLHNLFLSKQQEYQSTSRLTRPEHWGGYSLVPDMIEFWQGRASRLHDRIRFRLVDNKWIRERLAP